MIVKLEDVCIKSTSSIRQKDLINKDGKYSVYGASGIAGYLNSFQFEKPYVGVVKDGAGVGRAMYLPKNSSIIGTMQALIPKENILPKYLYYAVSAMHLDKYYSGATIPHIYFKNYRHEKINLVSVEEQKQIITIFSAIEKTINYRYHQLNKLDELIKARFVEMFGDPIGNQKGWETQTLEQSCSQILGGGTPSKVHSEYFNGNIPWVTPKDMKTRIIIDSKDHITKEAILRSSAKLIPANSVLMVIRSGILKHTLPVAINKVKVTMNQDMKAFVPNLYINSIFLENYFRAITPNILSKVRSVTADNINFKEFRKRKVLIPPLSLQNEFANFVQQVDKSKFENIVYLNKTLSSKILSQLGDAIRD